MDEILNSEKMANFVKIVKVARKLILNSLLAY